MHEHERMEVIASARNLDGKEFDRALRDSSGPGRLEGCSDRELALAIETIYGHGFADESGGDMSMQEHGIAVGPFVLFTDSAGFLSVETYDTAERAIEVVSALPTEFAEEV